MQDDPSRTSYRIAAPEPRRLDHVLSECVPHASRRVLRAAIASGAVRVNGRRGRKGDLLRTGDVVTLPPSLTVAALSGDATLRVDILHVDSDLIAVNKPAGMPTVALRATDRSTLANFLTAHYPETASIGDHPFECGAAHRLDNDTSGALLVARTAEAYRRLRQTFRERRVEKIYLAVVRGEIREPRILSTPLRPSGRRGARTVIADPQRSAARAAETEVWPQRRLRDATLLRVRITTGVRHQIRAHLASIGHPVRGDRLYGPGDDVSTRLLLHAAELHLRHPRLGEALHIDAPLPADFRAEIARLE